ncbi:MAG: class I SAM-dependent methyltransferase [Planctomycetales bacterium]|nr:class I SAM-dependent methyltransferase [Planctomycetales bacterium]
MDAATEAKVKAALASSVRSDDERARDAFRHPLETLKFFGLKDDMAVMEIWPSGGWYTKVIAPVLKDHGKYVAAHWDPDAPSEFMKKAVASYKEMLAANESLSKTEVAVLNPSTNKMTPVPAGSLDMVVTFRNIHNWMASGAQDAMFKSFYDSLKPGGYLGVVEHRASADKEQDPKAESGYVREDYAVALAEKAGFKKVAASDVNNNAKDTKDYPKGVWTLPPNYREGDMDREKFTAIGESDRFTLLFQKPAM